MTNKWFATAKPYLRTGILVTCFALAGKHTFAQADFKPWGNMNGVWIQGQLMPFETNVNVVGSDWSKVTFSGKEMQRPKYARDGDKQIVTTLVGGFKLTETVEDDGIGSLKLTVNAVAQKDTTLKGMYLGVALKNSIFAASMVKVDGKPKKLTPAKLNADGEYLHVTAKQISFKALNQSFSISTDTAGVIMMVPDTIATRKNIQLYLPVKAGSIKKGDTFERTFHFAVTGTVDTSPVTMKMDASAVGRTFTGFGGNFRLQNPKVDPEVIDYCLNNMRVAFGRVEMPWSTWQPDVTKDPIAMADSGKLNVRVTKAMEMAQRLGKMGMPVVVTAWAAPAWAIVGKPHYGKTPDGVWGNPLNHDMEPQIYKSIADYIVYLRDHYGVEASYFSFNESDLGINVRQTGEEHDRLIKGLGAYFAQRGLKTKMLLGDNSDATTYSFTYPALNDPAAKPYIGVVSFHSWRGFETETLQKWADIANKINLPLIVGEGSIDAQGFGYPVYFQEQGYAIEEINLYVRLLAICQPLSILQWQLTSDYSPLVGGGIYGDNSPLKPTWRFFNLKQLASTPANLHYLGLTADKKAVSCAALGDKATGTYTLHVVNSGATRKVHLTGLPANLKSFNVYVTDKESQMKKLDPVKVTAGAADFDLRSNAFTTLTTSEF